MVTLNGQPVCSLLVSGMQCCAVLKILVLPLPEDFATLRNYSIHGSLHLSPSMLSGITYDVQGLVYDLPADPIIYLNYSSFTKLWNENEQQKIIMQ